MIIPAGDCFAIVNDLDRVMPIIGWYIDDNGRTKPVTLLGIVELAPGDIIRRREVNAPAGRVDTAKWTAEELAAEAKANERGDGTEV